MTPRDRSTDGVPRGDPVQPAAVLAPPGIAPDAPVPSLDWTADGTRLVVAYATDVGPGPFLDNHGPDIGGLLVATGLAAALLLSWRSLRRPRAPGRRYCAHCNYDVGPSCDPPPARCAECGRELSPRRAPAGQAPLARFAPALAALAIAAVGASLAVWRTGPATHPRAYAAWPGGWFGRRWPGWPMWRLQYVPTLETRSVQYAVRRDGPWDRTPEPYLPTAGQPSPEAGTASRRIANITILVDQDEAGRLRLLDGGDHPALLGGLKGLVLRFNDADGTPVFQFPDRSPAVLSPDGRWVAAAFSPVPVPRIRGLPLLPQPDAPWRIWVWPLPEGTP